MEIINFGACINQGTYKLHSKFTNVQNFARDNELISLVTEKVGRGPNNIVLDKIPETENDSLSVSDCHLYLGGLIFAIQPIKTEIEDIFIYDPKLLVKQIEILLNEFSKHPPGIDLSFLLFPEHENNFRSAFEIQFVQQVKLVTSKFNIDNLPAIGHKMKGLGFGLTPSGDDFNCGILYALNYINKGKYFKITDLIDKCYQNSLGNNLISNNFLKYAHSNRFYENFFNLLKAMKENNITSISSYTKQVTNSGHTSGSDMLTGFIFTLKGVLNEKKFG
ncbi:MAG: DUF2877 domain-containing protein [Candidatus Cloacimonetes bacterium]|nr:DUF2877 domain-containing protein [Candidatus Cloacimonadota bacterium]